MLLLNAVETYAIRDRFGVRDRLLEHISYAWSETLLAGYAMPLEPEEIWMSCACAFDEEQMGDTLAALYDNNGDIVEENLQAVVNYSWERTQKIIRAHHPNVEDEVLMDAATCTSYTLYIILTDDMSRRLLTQPFHSELQMLVKKKNNVVRCYTSALDRVKGLAQRNYKYYISDYRHIGHEVLHAIRLANTQVAALIERNALTRKEQE